MKANDVVWGIVFTVLCVVLLVAIFAGQKARVPNRPSYQPPVEAR
jgi:hypothetical protein